jgi:hypothetical protein
VLSPASNPRPGPRPGVNQTLANGSKPGSYRFADAPIFSLDVDMQEGDRLGNADAASAVGYQCALS